MGELSWLLTVYELAFLLFGVKEAAQVEDDGQKEHEAGHSDDRHRLLTGDGAVVVLTPQPAGHVHLEAQSQDSVSINSTLSDFGHVIPVLAEICCRDSASHSFLMSVSILSRCSTLRAHVPE